MSDNLFREERLQIIMEMLYENKKVVVTDLAKKFNRSLSSIRLDLSELESRGLIERTHGGAILTENFSNEFVVGKNILTLRKETYKEEKQRIGWAVKDIIHDGDSIMIDGGSSSYYVAQHLNQRRGLTIITSSFFFMNLLQDIPDAKIYVAGGLYHKDFEDLVGEISVNTLQRFKPNYSIIGIDAISIKDGLTTTESSMAQIKRQMLAVASKTIVVADSSKFGKVCLFHVSDLEKIDYLVTDRNVPDNIVEYLKDTNVNLIVV